MARGLGNRWSVDGGRMVRLGQRGLGAELPDCCRFIAGFSAEREKRERGGKENGEGKTGRKERKEEEKKRET